MPEFGNTLEKRRERRIADENSVTLEKVAEGTPNSEKKICFAVTRDLSMGGMRVSCNTFYPVKTAVKIHLKLNRTRKQVRMLGTIRWIRCIYENELFDFGLQFEEITPEISMALIEHLYGRSSH